MRVTRELCAELLRFSRENSVEDWIDEGSSLLYMLRVGECCAEWPPFIGHPIVEVYAQSGPPDVHPFHCWV